MLCMCGKLYPSRYDWVDLFGVIECQSHEVGIQRSDSLKHQPDVTGRCEVQQGWRGVICTRTAVDQRRVDLYMGRQVNTDV